MLFTGHAQTTPQHGNTGRAGPATPGPSRTGTPLKGEPYGFGEGERRPIWQEVLHKARVRLCRTPMNWEFDHNQGYVPGGLFMPDQNSEYPENHAFGRPDEYAYHLEIVEDLDDGRLHDEDDAKSRPFDDIARAGIRESIPIQQISRIFYTDSGRILNIGNSDEAGNNPILLLKRGASAPSAAEVEEDIMSPGKSTPTRAIEGSPNDGRHNDQHDIDRQLFEDSEIPELPKAKAGAKEHPLGLHLPPHLDPEWLAFEVFTEDDDNGSSGAEDEPEDEGEYERPVGAIKSKRPVHTNTHQSSLDANLMAQIKTLTVQSPSDVGSTSSTRKAMERANGRREEKPMARSPFGSITSSLSLMEMLFRLTSLQEFQQAAHLSIPDYILSFFLDETSTTGLKGEERWKAKYEAKRRVGFDPYTDTPSR